MSLFVGDSITLTIRSDNSSGVMKAYAAVKAFYKGSASWVLSDIDYQEEGNYFFTITGDDDDTRLNVEFVRSLIGDSKDVTIETTADTNPDTVTEAIQKVATGELSVAAATKIILSSK